MKASHLLLLPTSDDDGPAVVLMSYCSGSCSASLSSFSQLRILQHLLEFIQPTPDLAEPPRVRSERNSESRRQGSSSSTCFRVLAMVTSATSSSSSQEEVDDLLPRRSGRRRRGSCRGWGEQQRKWRGRRRERG